MTTPVPALQLCAACYGTSCVVFISVLNPSISLGRARGPRCIGSAPFHPPVSFLSNRTHPQSSGITGEKVSIVRGLFLGIKIHYGGVSRQTGSPGKNTFPVAVKSCVAFSALFILNKLISLILPFSDRDVAPAKPQETEGFVSTKERKGLWE